MGRANDLRSLMIGGGTLSPQQATDLLLAAGFGDVTPAKVPPGTIVHARAA